MDISFSAQHEAFRDEVKQFLSHALTDELKQAAAFCPGIFLDYEHNMAWHKILYKQGWVAPAWPKEYGGTGWDLMQQYIWTTETSLAGTPGTAPMGLGMCGPMLIGHGTQAQKDYYLPRILSGEDYWCQGYSEPASGSDLASLQLKASSDGDHLVLNGSKIWTTHAHYANRMFILVRTDDTSRASLFYCWIWTCPASALSLFCLRPTPTRSTRCSSTMSACLRQILLGKRIRVGQLPNICSNLSAVAVAQRASAWVYNACGISLNKPTLPVRSLLMTMISNETGVKIEALQFTEFRIMAQISKGGSPGPESSIMKTLGADMSQYLSELMVEALAFYASPHQPEAREVGQNTPAIGPASGVAAFPRYFNYRASSIAGGSNEVQRNIVAKLVLGL